MEVSALKYPSGVGLHGRSPLLRLQSDERLVAFTRRGNTAAFETLVSRYESRLLSFCRHMLGCREDAEDVLQEVLAAAFNAILADERSLNVRPWLYRIARNRSLNHLRRARAVGVDSMDVHLSDHGASTADKVHDREEFRLLVGDIHELPETQKTALVLREMDALSYEQIAEAMEATIPSVKSLLVRARVSLAEASEARLLSCNEVRIELGEIAEGLRRRPSPLIRRHLRTCERCSTFRVQLRQTNKALAVLMPIGPLVVFKKLALIHLGHSAGSGATTASAGSGVGAAGASAAAGSTTAAGSTALAGSAAAAGSTVVAGSTAGGFVSAGVGVIATKAAVGLAAAALATAGAVEVDHAVVRPHAHAHGIRSLRAAVGSPGTSVRRAGAHRSATTGHHGTLNRGPGLGGHPGGLDGRVAATNKDPAGSKSKGPNAKQLQSGKAPSTVTGQGKLAVKPDSGPAPKLPAPAPGRHLSETLPTVLPPRATGPRPGRTAETRGPTRRQRPPGSRRTARAPRPQHTAPAHGPGSPPTKSAPRRAPSTRSS